MTFGKILSIILPWNNNLNGRQMQLFMGILLISVGAVGVVAQWLVGLHDYVDDASRYFLGPSSSGTFGSPVGEAVIYLVFYFIAMMGLAVLATSKRVG
jgi:hypothetical protein